MRFCGYDLSMFLNVSTPDTHFRVEMFIGEYEYGQAPRSSEGQGRLEQYSPWGHKEQGMTEQQPVYKGSLNTWFTILAVVTK